MTRPCAISLLAAALGFAVAGCAQSADYSYKHQGDSAVIGVSAAPLADRQLPAAVEILQIDGKVADKTLAYLSPGRHKLMVSLKSTITVSGDMTTAYATTIVDGDFASGHRYELSGALQADSFLLRFLDATPGSGSPSEIEIWHLTANATYFQSVPPK
jgi:hypothetical protein